MWKYLTSAFDNMNGEDLVDRLGITGDLWTAVLRFYPKSLRVFSLCGLKDCLEDSVDIRSLSRRVRNR